MRKKPPDRGSGLIAHKSVRVGIGRSIPALEAGLAALKAVDVPANGTLNFNEEGWLTVSWLETTGVMGLPPDEDGNYE